MFAIYKINDQQKIDQVLALTKDGLSDYEVARKTGVSRSTVRNWRRFGVPEVHTRTPLERPLDDRLYSYLLGVYLGDGWVGPVGRASALRVVLDANYPDIIRECAGAIGACLVRQGHRADPKRRFLCRPPIIERGLAGAVSTNGPGKKHERKIALVGWQRLITHHYSREFIRGLIHSDGSRCINRFSVKLPSGRVGRYAYPRYFFTNYSADIRGIFCEHCDLLGIRWSQSNPRNISVSHRDSVAPLDSFVGPKS